MNRLLLFFILLPIFSLAQNSIGFIKESIDFEINDKVFKTNGIYTFVNNTGKTMCPSIVFPFSETADSVVVGRVYNLKYGELVKFKRLKSAISFNMKLNPYDTVVFNVLYTQKASHENTYILKSTSFWGLPLTEANYSLLVAESIELDSLNYLPDTLINNIYYWKKENFMPENDFKVFVK